MCSINIFLKLAVFLCLLIYSSAPCATVKSLLHTHTHIASFASSFEGYFACNTLTFLAFLNEFEFVTPWMIEFHAIFNLLRRTWVWIARDLFCNVLIFSTVLILLGNNQKIKLKWKQNLLLSRRYVHRAGNLKIVSHLKVWV